ncbi:MAG: aminomethyl-transferring glycine dehydrogenase [Calditrichia bacterium]
MSKLKKNIRQFESFESRHLNTSSNDVSAMLQKVGVASLDELIDKTVPQSIRLKKELAIDPAQSEHHFLTELKATAAKNSIYKSYIGMGYHDCIVPNVILRNVLENPSWYTSYTPYQAEISQGRLEALINYQTAVADLTGMEISNASLLDEGTAAAEAMVLLYRARSAAKRKQNANVFLVSSTCLPQTIDILKTRSVPMDIELRIQLPSEFNFSDDVFGALLQYPDLDGNVHDYSDLIATAHEKDVLVTVSADLLSLVLLKSPGSMGADAVVGSAQRFGVPMGYGGPHSAFLATKEAYKRQLPGRLIGVSVDRHGNKAYRMALQTREQHIRREKATSNICTAQVLLANMAGFYAVYHGPEGLKEIAERVHAQAKILSTELTDLGFEQLNKTYFDTIKIALGDHSADDLQKAALASGINFRYIDGRHVGISVNETTDLADVDAILAVFSTLTGASASAVNLDSFNDDDLRFSSSLKRNTPFMEHPVFHKHRSETDMMRYIKSLEEKDLSLTNSMIPLGSCTMKLNAAAELIPVTWPEFGKLHPFVPKEQAAGYSEIFTELERMLCQITGFDAVSLQPNSGAQGEYAGMMVIRAYHQNHGDHHRNVALIPSSAHGTNPASAIMAGMKVVVIRCEDNGNIDLQDLREKAEKHADALSALMITYPSTHGVFEETVQEACSIVHEFGGQVYMDGANMNAQVGLTNPGLIGADVCHLNLHKTFSIPHGGGGPGMGPICVAKHLAPYLPGHVEVETGGSKAISAISAAPWGSASILLISYAYIKMLGLRGITESTRYAILNANYIKACLEGYYKALYTGSNGFVAHELIIDTRVFKGEAGVDAEDIAKRLMDYGFHAPTMSWPVIGTMMIEPTESESKAELDRFCEAMLSIYREIQDVKLGVADAEDNVLKNSPHTATEALSSDWEHAYSREQAVYPLPFVRLRKFWPTVGRIDNAFGDRNLVCACPPLEEYSEVE